MQTLLCGRPWRRCTQTSVHGHGTESPPSRRCLWPKADPTAMRMARKTQWLNPCGSRLPADPAVRDHHQNAQANLKLLEAWIPFRRLTTRLRSQAKSSCHRTVGGMIAQTVQMAKNHFFRLAQQKEGAVVTLETSHLTVVTWILHSFGAAPRSSCARLWSPDVQTPS